MKNTIKQEFTTKDYGNGLKIDYSTRELLTEKEVINILNISKKRLRKLWQNGKIGQELFFLRNNNKRLYLTTDIECFIEWHKNAHKKIK